MLLLVRMRMSPGRLTLANLDIGSPLPPYGKA